MAGHHLIDAHLAALARRLPADTVDELGDGLLETWSHHRARGLTADEAARAAIAEFGPADRIVDEFVRQSPGRRTARVLLAIGPGIGLCWGTGLVAAKAWTWPIPPTIGAAVAGVLLAVIAALLAAATSRHSYRRTRLGGLAALTFTVLDATIIAAVAALAPAPSWPLAAGIVASLARLGFTIRALPAALTG